MAINYELQQVRVGEAEDCISVLEEIQAVDLEIALIPAVKEIKQAGRKIAENRIAGVALHLADVAADIEFDDLEKRRNELEARNVPVQPDTEKYDDFLQLTKKLVPEAKAEIEQREETYRLELEEHLNTALSDKEMKELEQLRSINEVLSHPIAVDDLYDKMFQDPLYVDTFPREEIEIAGQTGNGVSHEVLDVDRQLLKKITDFLKEQPLMETITLEQMFHLLHEGLEEKAYAAQLKDNARTGLNRRPDNLLRAKLRPYLNPNKESGVMLIETLRQAGLVLQRGGRRIKGTSGQPLVIVRVLSAKELTDPALQANQLAETYIDRWDTPLLSGELPNVSVEQDVTFTEEQSPGSVSVEGIIVEPAEVAKAAIKQAAMMPLLRQKVLEIFVERQQEVISLTELVKLLQEVPDIAKYIKSVKYYLSTPLGIVLNPAQGSGRATERLFEEHGIVLERGIINTASRRSRGPIGDPRVYRLRPAKSEAPSEYPYEEKVKRQTILWENTLGSYDKSTENQPDSKESAKTPETKDELKPEVDTNVLLKVRTFKVVNVLSEAGILATTHGASDIVALHPEKIPANGHGDVKVKKLLRELKELQLLQDDRNVTVRQMVIAALLPFYKDDLAKQGKARGKIFETVDQVINDYFEQRRKLKQERARSGRLPRRS
jgi:hypothetical protein